MAAVIPPPAVAVQWYINQSTGGWFRVSLPPDRLKMRAKGKLEWAVGYHHTSKTLGSVSNLLQERKRAVAILRTGQIKAHYFQKATAPVLRAKSIELAKSHIEFSERRNNRMPTDAEKAWFMDGTPLPSTETDSESYEDPITDDLLGDTFEDELDALLSAPDPEDAEL